MAISIDSPLGDILACPEAVNVLESLSPGCTDNPTLSLISGVPLRVVLQFPDANCDEATAKLVEEGLAALNL